MNDKELQQAFIQFLAQKSGAKNQKQLEEYVKSLGEKGLEQAYNEFTELMKSQTQKAKHGAKLNYIKSLKHKCAEDEELVYYKKGGRVDCGCVKKNQDGGKATKQQKSTPVSKFKNRKKEQPKLKPETTKTLPNGKYPKYWTADDRIKWERLYGKNEVEEAAVVENKGVGKNKKGGELKKDCGGTKLKLKKKGGEVCSKCGKIHAAGMGCAVAKFKYRKLGGQL